MCVHLSVCIFVRMHESSGLKRKKRFPSVHSNHDAFHFPGKNTYQFKNMNLCGSILRYFYESTAIVNISILQRKLQRKDNLHILIWQKLLSK